jgi:hypothetical protein
MRTTVRKLHNYPTLGLGLSNSVTGKTPDRKRAAADTVALVVSWLNTKPNASTKRVENLIEACHRTSALVEDIKASVGPNSGQDKELVRAISELNMGLGRYKWHPGVLASMDAASHFKILFGILSAPSDPTLAVEHYAVQWIVEYVDAVHRVRRCRVRTCRQWFYAKTDHQKYCGPACRQKDASQGDTFKEKRRDYMKKYRSGEAERDERAKRIANRLARRKGK